VAKDGVEFDAPGTPRVWICADRTALVDWPRITVPVFSPTAIPSAINARALLSAIGLILLYAMNDSDDLRTSMTDK
jgi:hypothetical protein